MKSEGGIKRPRHGFPDFQVFFISACKITLKNQINQIVLPQMYE